MPEVQTLVENVEKNVYNNIFIDLIGYRSSSYIYIYIHLYVKVKSAKCGNIKKKKKKKKETYKTDMGSIARQFSLQ